MNLQSKLEIRQKFARPSNWQGSIALGRDLFFLAGAWWLAAHYGQYWAVSVLLIWFIGMVQFAMGESLLHEASHHQLFKSKVLNSLVGNLIAWTIFTTLEEWRGEHQVHHGYLLSPNDHLTQDYVDYQLYEGIHPFVLWVLRPILGIIGLKWIKSEWSGLFRHKAVFFFYLSLIVICWLTNSLLFFFLYWLLPLIWVYASVLYWSEITDHYLSTAETRSNTSFFWNFMFHNGGYHWVHHEYPYIPHYLLKKADKALREEANNRDRVSSWWGMYQVMLQAYQTTSKT